jgi:hypothetical protein
MRRWYDTKEEAIRAACDGGWFCWFIRRLTRNRHGTHWSYTFRYAEPGRWYVGLDPPAVTKRKPNYFEIREEAKL